jgi:TRAP-type C4-dicarboxylate transport system permease large subunit
VIASLADDIDINDIFRGVAPFFFAELIRIAILFSLPILALALPSMLSG